MKKNADEVKHIKAEAESAKWKLIELRENLYAAYACKEAEQLGKIIARLEAWQNK